MSKKQEFLDFVDYLISHCDEPVEMTGNVKDFYTSLKDAKEEEKPLFTENGKQILQYMQSTDQTMLKARDIAEGMFTSSKMVSGAIRKLVTDGFVEKMGKDPVVYALTETGKNITI